MYVADFDDLCDGFDPWDALLDIKEKFPNFKCTLFAIPARCSDELLAKYASVDWIELGAHGYHHSPQECLVWGREEALSKLDEIEPYFAKVFKAPGWQMNEHVYEALAERGWIVADHATYAWPSKRMLVTRYTYNLPGNKERAIHGHTWDCTGNGPSDWPTLFKSIQPDAEFSFVSEVAKPMDWGWEFTDEQEEENSWSHKSAWGRASMATAAELFAEVPESERGVLVDFGGNDGTVGASLLDKFREVWSLEGSTSRTQFSNANYPINTVCVNLERLPIDGQPFDWGYCSHTVEHLPNLDSAWEKMKSLCKYGIFVVAPVEDDEHFRNNEAHFHQHTAQGWCDRLGLEMVKDKGIEVVGVWRR